MDTVSASWPRGHPVPPSPKCKEKSAASRSSSTGVSRCSCPPTACPEGEFGMEENRNFFCFGYIDSSIVTMCVCLLSHSAMSNSAIPGTASCQSPLSHPGITPTSAFPALAGRFFTTESLLCMGSPFHTQKRAKIITLGCLFLVMSSNLLLPSCLSQQKKFIYILAPPLPLGSRSSETLRGCLPGCSP